MVKILFLIGTLLSVNALADKMTAADLRARMMGADSEKKASSERLKLMRDGSHSATLLKERELFYELPSGRRVQAMLLPNGKRSPAIDDRGRLVPACYTTKDTLVKGEYDLLSKRVVCNIPASEIAYIDDDLYAQNVQAEHSNNKGFLSSSGENKTGGNKPQIAKYEMPSRDSVTPTGGLSGALGNAPSSNKPASNNRQGGGQPQAAPEKPLPEGTYIPNMAARGTPAKVAVMAFNQDKPYGIQRGKWLNIRLSRSVSSSDSGQTEFYLENEVAGDYQTLPSGTVFFANKSINLGTKRMEAFVTLGKLPNGKEFKVNGWVYSLNETAGLDGVLERDREGENKAAVGNAALASLGTAASSVGAGGDIAGAAINSYTGEMVGNERKYGERAPAATIRVSAQRALLLIAEPF